MFFEEGLILLLGFEKGFHHSWPSVEVDLFPSGHPELLGVDFQFYTFEKSFRIDE
jgi:hypothetical protein